MKTIKFFGMLFAAFALSFTATSCGDDDIEDLEHKVENGELKTTVTLKETADQLVLTAKTEKVSTQTYTANFRERVCVSCTFAAEFANKQLADEFEKEMKGEMDLKRDGNKFTADMSKDFAGLDYAAVKMSFEYIKRGFESNGAK